MKNNGLSFRRNSRPHIISTFIALIVFFSLMIPTLALASIPHQAAKLTASDGAQLDYFGGVVAVSGDTVLIGGYLCDIGENRDQGAAYVFTRNGGSWSQQAKLVASDGKMGDSFGLAVALDENTAVVTSHSGVYVFTRNGANWLQQAKLPLARSTGNTESLSVAISGDTIIVGTTYDSGSAYVFVRNGTNWAQQATLTASNDQQLPDYKKMGFGSAVAISGDTVVVADRSGWVGGMIGRGAAFVYSRSGTTWTQQSRLTANDGQSYDSFGCAVAISGDTIVVGAAYDDVGGEVAQGSVYIFIRRGAKWIQEAEHLVGSNGAQGDLFGESVSIDGDIIIVGAEGKEAYQGAAYVFARNSGSWSQQAHLTANDGKKNDSFGEAVAISGDSIVIGSSGSYVNGASNQGAAYIFETCSNFIYQETLFAGDAAFDSFRRVALSNDTLVVGAPYSTIGNNANQGAAYVFIRRGIVWTFQAKLTASNGQENDHFGTSVAISRDTIVVGGRASNSWYTPNPGMSKAYVFTRNGSTWTRQQQLLPILPSGEIGSDGEFGYSVAIHDDTIVVGVDCVGIWYGWDCNTPVYVFVRNGTNWTQQGTLPYPLESTPSRYAVAISGDTVVVGSSFANRAYVFVRNGVSWSRQEKLVANDGQSDDDFGYAVAISGNTIIVGAPHNVYSSEEGRGAAYVFAWNGVSWMRQAKLVANDTTKDKFGASLAIYKDTIAVGSFSKASEGSAYVFVHGAENWNFEKKLTGKVGPFSTQAPATALSNDTIVLSGGWAEIFALSRCPALSLTPTVLPNGIAGASYSQTLRAVGGIGPYSYAVSRDKLPPEMTLTSNTGELSGVFKATGTYQFKITTTDTKLGTGSRLYNLKINCPEIDINSPPVPDGIVGSPYKHTFTQTGAAGWVSFSISNGILPITLRLSSRGELWGPLQETGSFHFTVKAVDANGCYGSRNYVLVSTCPIVTVIPPSIPPGVVGVEYSQSFSQTGGTPWITYTAEGRLPSGLRLRTGVLSGTPTEKGTFQFTIKAADAYGCCGTREYRLVIN